MLAVGDSCTWGADVGDQDTWPAHLERRLGIRVGNAGVWGYGVDQMCLRANALLDKQHIDWLLMCVVPDDVCRCEYDFKFAWWKPHYTVDRGQLTFHPAPLDRQPPSANTWWARLLENSYFAHVTMMRLMPQIWLSIEWFDHHIHDRGPEISALLIKQLSAHCTRTGTRLVLIVRGELDRATEEQYALVGPMIKAANDDFVPVIDLISPLHAETKGDPEISKQWRAVGGHFNSWGNRWVAKRIQEALHGIESEAGTANRQQQN